MTCKTLTTALGALLVAASTTSMPCAAGPAHVHGVARLDIAVEAKQKITLVFESPLDNLLGFERAPRNDAERKQADALAARLKAADALFRIDPAAMCKLQKAELNSSALGLGKPDPAEPGHAEVDASFEFQCVDAAKAAYIEVGLFAAFPRLQRIEVQGVTPRSQFKRDLKRPASRVDLKAP